jgi:hypothetical protein
MRNIRQLERHLKQAGHQVIRMGDWLAIEGSNLQMAMVDVEQMLRESEFIRKFRLIDAVNDVEPYFAIQASFYHVS